MQVTYIMHVCEAHNGVPVEKHTIKFIYGSSSFYILKNEGNITWLQNLYTQSKFNGNSNCLLIQKYV